MSKFSNTYKRGMPLKEQYAMICALVKRNPGVIKREVHKRTGIPMRTLHRRTKELASKGILVVENGRLTVCEDLPKKRINAQIRDPVFEFGKRLPADVVEKGIKWLSVKAFFGLCNRDITFQDDGIVQKITIETNGSLISCEDCQKLWRLLKEAFRVPFVCVDYGLVIHGHEIGHSLETYEEMEDLLDLAMQKYEDNKIVLTKDCSLQRLAEEIEKLR